MQARGHVLLQHRALWSHHGGTWGVPGGARDQGEAATQAALREAAEESTLDLGCLVLGAEHRDDHGGWSYTTVTATAPDLLSVRPRGGESIAVRWVPVADVATLALHPGFARSWPALVDGRASPST